jgi:hypothetical protein
MIEITFRYVEIKSVTEFEILDLDSKMVEEAA